MQYNKLVRDNIPDIIKANGEAVKYHIAESEEYGQKLREKLKEEVEEFLKDESIFEIADILEVIDALAKEKGFSEEEIARIKLEKAQEKGAFDKKIILDES